MSASVVVTDYKSEHVLSSLGLGWPLPWRSAHLRLVEALESLLPGQTGELVLRFPPGDEWLLEDGRAHSGHRTAGQRLVGMGKWARKAGPSEHALPSGCLLLAFTFIFALTFAVRRCRLQECGECALPMCSGIPSLLSPPPSFLWVTFRHDRCVSLDTQDDSTRVVSFCT